MHICMQTCRDLIAEQTLRSGGMIANRFWLQYNSSSIYLWNKDCFTSVMRQLFFVQFFMVQAKDDKVLLWFASLKWNLQTSQELNVKMNIPCHRQQHNHCRSFTDKASESSYTVIGVCVHLQMCTIRLMHSDKLITHFLSHHLTSLTIKDWLPFASYLWVFVLLPCHLPSCVRVIFKSSRLSPPQVRFRLDPVFSHDALQAESFEIVKAMAERQIQKNSYVMFISWIAS